MKSVFFSIGHSRDISTYWIFSGAYRARIEMGNGFAVRIEVNVCKPGMLDIWSEFPLVIEH